MTSTSPTYQQNDSAFNSIRSYEDFSELEDEEEIDKLLDLQTRIFEAICNESRTTLRKLFDTSSASLILQILLTFIYPNTDLHFCHDTDFIYDAEELLGNSVKNLNAIQAACMLGDEELALDILNFVTTQCELMDARKVLFEFLSKVWGENCTTLHLASFMGMSELVKKLLESGANPNKVNDRKYKPVDCADDDKTRALFLNLSEGKSFLIFQFSSN
ncbi:hypothetical protein CONCODRAFT_125205 [Conidiobolus coronatus NRRL 28638]|uniref:Uncharacterized protein n=1 Tax=Conidiobolus coronatus (strain ATCC 28846 / CBS 209.66 / NRRL 28638) TaxID=796925 RepID=A0A137NVJ8_CONC2|nr:hypothetical protein CONCODRAFT_125205 [Conidiobolus coronatus NRRL 28638]|eukprot:KXN66689.1 hypothetical protein CONCODRAFT_125205 [Conidiobolus coronatus NRRL 28638]